MHRNLYDTDCITWSPQGRIFQIEYAMEGVKQGSCIVGLKSDTHAVLVSLRRSVSKLASMTKKIIKLDDHLISTLSGLTADGKTLARYIRSECMQYEYVYGKKIPVQYLVTKVADKSQTNTQKASKRPYGVGLLLAGFDNSGTHIYETSPDGKYFEHYAMSLGNRCQPAKTYLEKNFERFPTLTLEELMLEGMKALKGSLPQDQELSYDSVSVGIVGKQCPAREATDEELREIISRLPATPVPVDVEMTPAAE